MATRFFVANTRKFPAKAFLALLFLASCRNVLALSSLANTTETNTTANAPSSGTTFSATITIPIETRNEPNVEFTSRPKPAPKMLTAKMRRVWHDAGGDAKHDLLDDEAEDAAQTVWSPATVPNSLTARQQLDNGGFYAPPEEAFSDPPFSSAQQPIDHRRTQIRFPTKNRRQFGQSQRLRRPANPPARPHPVKDDPLAAASNFANSSTTLSDQQIIAKLRWFRKAGLLQLLLPGPQVDTQCDCPPVACNCGNTTSGGESVSTNMIVCLCNCNGTAVQTSPANGDAVSARNSCPLDFVPDSAGIRPSSTCYHLSTLKASWTDANQECQKMDAKLVEPRTAIDLRKVIQLLISARQRVAATPTDEQYWIGGLQVMFGGSSVPVFKSDMQELPNAISQQISQKRAAPLNRCLGLVRCSAEIDGGEQCETSSNGYVLAAMPCQQDNLFVCQLNSH